MVDIAQLMGNTMQSYQNGRAQGQQSKLAQLLAKGMQAPDQRKDVVAQMAAVNPQAAFDAESHFGQMDDRARQDLGRAAAVFSTLPEAQKVAEYPRLVAQARAAGIPVPPDDQYKPEYAPHLANLARLGDMGGGKQEMASHVINGRLVDNTGKVLYEAPTNGQLVNVPDGQGGSVQMLFDPSTGQLTQPQYGGAPQTAGPSGGAGQMLGDAYRGAMAPEQVQPLIQQLAGQFGGQISSLTRTPEHNREVGGVPNSQHIRGTAGDVVIGDPAQRAAYMQAARAAGLQVIDEGDHLHTQLPHGQQTAQSAGRLGYTPPKPNGGKPAPNGYRWNAAGGLEVIPGGPAEVAQAARADAAAAKKAAQDAKVEQQRQGQQQRQVEAASTAGDLVSAIDRLTQSPGFSSLGTAMGDIAISTPLIRSDAKDANEQLHTIAGQVALATMSRLKALSAQGATGFGALSEKELKLLQGAIATLQSDQISNKELKDSLAVIREKMQKVSDWKAPAGYSVGQIIEHGGKKYRITGLSDPNDPDVEEVR